MLNIEKYKKEIAAEVDEAKRRGFCGAQLIGMPILEIALKHNSYKGGFGALQTYEVKGIIEWLCKETKLTNAEKHPNTFVETLFDPATNMYMARVIDRDDTSTRYYLSGNHPNSRFENLAEIDEAYQEWLLKEVEEDA